MKQFDDLLTMAKMHFDDAEIYYSSSREKGISLFEGEVDKFEEAQSGGLGFRGILDGKVGYSYSEKLDPEVFSELINAALTSAEVSEDEEFFFDGQKDYAEVEPKELVTCETAEVIERMKQLEKAILAAQGIDKVSMMQYMEIESETRIKNTLGLSQAGKAGAGIIFALASASQDDDVYSGSAVKVFHDFLDVDIDELAKEVIEDTLSGIGASSVPSGDYPIFLDKDVFSNFLQAFSSVFNAEMVQKDLSLLKGKLGDMIASEKVTLRIDPHHEDAPMSSHFDDEGYPTQAFSLIENGKLHSFFHNLATAKKDGVESTGSAVRGYKGKVSLAPSFLLIEGGEKSEEEIISSMDKGIYIKELSAMHSGLNPTSGDFSLPAKGFLIEEGKIRRPVNQIVVAGNFFSLIQNIEELSKERSHKSFSSSVPSILIKELSVAGDQ